MGDGNDWPQVRSLMEAWERGLDRFVIVDWLGKPSYYTSVPYDEAQPGDIIVYDRAPNQEGQS